MRKSVCFFALLPLFACAQLRMENIFSDNMVLQRDKPVHFWGKGDPGKTIEISFAGEQKNVAVMNDSSWSVYFKPHKASREPLLLTVTCKPERIELKNILVGDVWLCIGQSNMEWPVIKEMHYKEAIQNSDQPLLRFFNPAYAGKNIFGTKFTDSVAAMLTSGTFYRGNWQVCDSSSFKMMSAVAYYFGKAVLQNRNVPVGLINLSIGGAPLETFIDKEILKADDRFSAKVKGDWLMNDALPVWVRERGKQNAGLVDHVPADEFGKNHAFKPGFAYEAGIKPFTGLPVKGLLCYQGESNAQETKRVDEYGALSALMVDDYRKKWNQPDLPFYYVQLSSIDTAKYKGQLWPQFRDEQRKIMDLVPYSGMAVCSDMGAKDDVHPTNKKDVGERLARWALNKTYKQHILPSGPLPSAAVYAKGQVVVTFQYAGKGLKTSDGKAIRGFSVDGKDDAAAIPDKKRIIIPVSSKPDYIYYSWKPYTDGNLINDEYLPASTFKIKVK